MGEGSCVPHFFPSFILKLGRKRTLHSSNFISPYPTPSSFFKKEFSASERFALRRLFLDFCCCGWGWGSVGRQSKPDSKDRLSFVPQWTINRLTQERNSKYSCLNRLKFEGGGGWEVGQSKEGMKREGEKQGEATQMYFVNSSSWNVYLIIISI